MGAEEEDKLPSVTGSYTFRGMDYVVSMWVDDDQNTVTTEVEDRLTTDQWRGTFDAAYIEDLTHKTGNFKQFSIFTSMLESAIKKSSDSVTLDLLTYSDLETLRSRKAGVTRSNIPGAQKAALSAKRYLIVTYTVEFDRIHYPLPLPYQGKPDPVALQDTVRELKKEIRKMQSQVHSDFRSNELQRLKKDYEDLLKEKQNLDDEFLQYRREVKNTSKGTAVKEVRILKTVVRNLEEELMNERRKFQRSSSKRNQDYKNLMEEVEELRASERNLRVRVKSLINELAVIKSSSRRVSRSPSLPLPISQRSTSRRSISTQERARLANARDASRERARMVSRERSTSRDRRRPPSVSSVGSRSPSPAGARVPRFDPTAYTQEKKRRQDEAKSRRERRRSRTLSSGSQPPRSQERGRPRTRPSPSYPAYSRPRSRSNSSVGSRGSRVSTSGLSDIDVLSDSSQKRTRVLNNVRKQRRTASTAWDNPTIPYRRAAPVGKPKRMMSTPDPLHDPDRAQRVTNQAKIRQKDLYDYGVDRDQSMYNRSSEMTEIDARLNALQKFMSNIPQ
ncbi:centrosomal protein CCDC61-like [Asterias amurensis]|uniref:centrosomal protein CCDC61-like n=1 Tax=Asterias amurensis TaxID=7602 RepID=UPI003AB910D4